MNNQYITHFQPESERLKPFEKHMEFCPNENGIDDMEWGPRAFSHKMLVYGNGAIGRTGETLSHKVDPDELELCKKLAREVCSIMQNTIVGMGSEACDPFYEFFIVANVGEPIPEKIDASLIIKKFNGTLHPLLEKNIYVEPLEEKGMWWDKVTGYYDGEDDPEELKPWPKMIEWFHNQKEFKDCAFVSIGESSELTEAFYQAEDEDSIPPGTDGPPCELPRLPLGLTKNGSLIGLFGIAIHT